MEIWEKAEEIGATKEKMYEKVKFTMNIKEPAENRLKKYDKEIQKRFATRLIIKNRL